MANRDYGKEYKKTMESNSQIAIKIPKQLFEDFSAKVESNGTNKRTVLLQMIEDYTYSSQS